MTALAAIVASLPATLGFGVSVVECFETVCGVIERSVLAHLV